MMLLTAALLGACFGSFLNVVAHRSVQGRPWWGSERSVCESCGHVLGFWELVPVFSWLVQRGKCKSCGAEISVRYILVELLCAILAVIIVSKFGTSWPALIVSVATCGLVVNSLTDFETGDVFDVLALTPGVVCVALRFAGGVGAVLDGLAGMATGWAVFAVIILLTRGGMGWGDAVFMAGAGGALGFKLTIFAFYAGIMTGGLWVILMMLIGRLHWGKGEAIALVPFLAIGCFISLVFGSEIFGYLSTRILSPKILALSWPFGI